MKFKEKIDVSCIPQLKEDLLVSVNEIITTVLKEFAEKEELKNAVKYFEKLIKNLHQYVKNKFLMAEENDDAMLSKK